MVTIKMHAPFFIGRWQWLTWTTDIANTHAACAAKAAEVGATMWDASQASIMIGGRVVQGNPTVFS